MINKEFLLEEILAQVAPEGEEAHGIYKWQIALLLPDVIRQLVTEIVAGVYPLGANQVKNTGVSASQPDISNLQSQLKRNFVIPIIGGGDGTTSLAPALNSTEPMILSLPFTTVRHASITSGLSIYTPDVEELNVLGEIYLDEMIVYSVDEYPFAQNGTPSDADSGTNITTAKRLVFTPKTLTGNIEITSYYIPTVDKMPDIFKPFIIQMTVAMLMAKRSK